MKCQALPQIHKRNWPKSNALTSATHAKVLWRIVAHKKVENHEDNEALGPDLSALSTVYEVNVRLL